jgi:TetR/AcrR family transcriptional regulator, mexJK operon transcriptional repressor
LSAPPRKTDPAAPTRHRTAPPAEPAPSAAVDDKAAAVLAGARSVFLAHGFSAATTDMIQKAAGVSKATVYARYATKEALFIAVIEAECERFLGTVRATAIRPRKLRDSLEAMAQAYLRVVLSPAGLALYRTVVGEAPRFPALARQFYLVGPHGFNAIVERYLGDAAARGEVDFSSVGLEMAAVHFVNLVRGEAQMQCLTHPDAVPAQAQYEHWATAAATTFVRAFGKA